MDSLSPPPPTPSFSCRIKRIMRRRSWPFSHIVYSGENYCGIFANADSSFSRPLCLHMVPSRKKMSYLAVGCSGSRWAFGVMLLWQAMDKRRRATCQATGISTDSYLFRQNTKTQTRYILGYSHNCNYCVPNQATCKLYSHRAPLLYFFL